MHVGTSSSSQPRPSAELFYSIEAGVPCRIKCCFCGFEKELNSGAILWDLERFFHHEDLTIDGPERHKRYAAGIGNRQSYSAQRAVRLFEARRSA